MTIKLSEKNIEEEFIQCQLRLEVIKLAVGIHAGTSPKASDVIETAKAIRDFVLGTPAE